MAHSETNYQNWIQAQLEPDGIIIVGRMKREPTPIKPIPVHVDDKIKSIEEEEADNRRQDEYLKKYGII